MRKYLLTIMVAGLVFSCGKKEENGAAVSSTPSTEAAAPAESAGPVDTAANGVPEHMANKGIGPVTSVTLGDIDQARVEKGKAEYEAYCTACHKPDKKLIGPAPKGILERRSPEWVMNMILNPEEMIANDPIGKQLLMEANGAPMSNQNLNEEQARDILEYFRTL